jgi:hypothetical protein
MKINLKQIINSTRGKYVFSILLGLGLATLFRKACNNRNCLVFKAPSIQDIKGKVFGHNDKCYEYKEESTTCPKDDKNNVVLEMGK